MSEHAISEEKTAALVPVSTPGTGKDAIKITLCSALGIFMFFIPITVGGKNTIPLDHVVTWVKSIAGPTVPWLMLALVLFGTVRPFITGRWKKSTTQIIFSFLNVLGLVATVLMMTSPPEWLADKSIGPFLWNTLVTSVGLIVPIGAIFLGFLIGFGLMEFVGVFVRPIMYPIWKTPGRSAVDAVASFVGSYSLGLLLTNRVYKQGGYTAKEAAIIATGFSTVSVTFMVIVANTLNIMDLWLQYFFTAFFVTFVVTAICVRIPPLSRIPDAHFPGSTPNPEQAITSQKFRVAWGQARGTLRANPGILATIWLNLKDGVIMASAILPSIMSVGLLGLLGAKYTPIFDWMGWIFVPFTKLAGMPDALLGGKAISLGLVEMFLPATEIGPDGDRLTAFIVAVVAVSGIIFLSAMVPSIMATDIPVKFWHLLVIWVERVILSILITAPIAHLIL